MRRAAQVIRTVGVLIGLVVATVGAWWWGAPDRAAALAPRPLLTDLIAAAAATSLPLALLWLTVLVALLALEPLAGRPLTGLVGCPPVLRRLLLGLVGATVVGALAMPAQATPTRAGDAPSPGPADTTGQSARVPGLLDGLPLPDRPTGIAPRDAPVRPTSPTRALSPGAVDASRTARTAAGSTPARRSTGRPTVTVRPGDSLWRLAERRLPTASAAEVAREVTRLYDANRDRIGADPDLILPGTILRSAVEADDPQEDPS